MTTTILLIIVGVLIVAAIVAVLIAVGAPLGSKGLRRRTAVSESLRTMVVAQRAEQNEAGIRNRKKGDRLALKAAEETDLDSKRKSSGSQLSLDKKLRYARWPITPLQFRGIQAVVAIACFIPAYWHLQIIWQVLAPTLGALLVNGVLTRAIGSRFKKFDDDYPVLLLSYVSLLKTGMTTIAGLESSGKGLDESSLVRAEVELLIERLRLGLTEEQAISSFGEDIAHPELELFVQSLLLSKRVGGQLSSTLERLARQVRKRQEFRKRAVAAIGMERGSMWAIGGIMSALLLYMFIKSPELILPAFKSETGINIYQFGIAFIVVGVYWMKNVTNIKV